jgi:hypothetical protein
VIAMIWFPMSVLLNVAVSLFIAFLASNKGRSAMSWFLGSFFVGWFFNANIILLIILLLSPDIGEQQTRLAQESAWRRRHHEAFEQERTTNRHFREHMIKRLDRQDEALGLPKIEELPPEAPLPPKEIVTYPMMGDGTWYLVINGQEYGPVSEAEVVEKLIRGEISGDTYAWSEGMQDWVRAQNIGNFSAHC